MGVVCTLMIHAKENRTLQREQACRWLSILLRMSTFLVCHKLIKGEFSSFISEYFVMVIAETNWRLCIKSVSVIRHFC